MISRSTAKGWCVVPRPKSQIISALFSTTYDFAVLKMGLISFSRSVVNDQCFTDRGKAKSGATQTRA